jgi:hypothetical protein
MHLGVESETFYGTYSVNPDCTGTVDVKIFSNNVELFEVTLGTYPRFCELLARNGRSDWLRS